MAPAEMVRGGAIVWVPNGGGQTEIVGQAPLLRYDSEQQAAEQIVAVMRDAGRKTGARAPTRENGRVARRGPLRARDSIARRQLRTVIPAPPLPHHPTCPTCPTCPNHAWAIARNAAFPSNSS